MQTLSVIPFYTSELLQEARKPWAYNNLYPLLVSVEYLLPFYFITPAGLTIKSIFAVPYKAADFEKPLPIGLFENNGLGIVDIGDGNQCIYYKADEVEAFRLTVGSYYLRVTMSDDSVYYSEVFSCINTDELKTNYVSIEWSCADNLEYTGGIVPYNERFVNRLYLNSDVGMPEYLFEEEGETRDSFFLPVKQLSYKKYKFVICVPEFICDTMRAIRLSDSIQIKDCRGKVYNATSFLMDSPDWLDDGFYASVNCEFTTDTVVKKIGKVVKV